MQLDRVTETYVARRAAEGKTSRDAQRCLKRTICRQILKLIERPSQRTSRTLKIHHRVVDFGRGQRRSEVISLGYLSALLGSQLPPGLLYRVKRPALRW
ncbi:hypothetical protein [Streptomyces sp. NPDC005141]